MRRASTTCASRSRVRPDGLRALRAGVVACVLAVRVVTAAIGSSSGIVPVLSLGVLYVFAVLPIAVAWGSAYAVPVAVASMLAFNFFFLPPVYTLHAGRQPELVRARRLPRHRRRRRQPRVARSPPARRGRAARARGRAARRHRRRAAAWTPARGRARAHRGAHGRRPRRFVGAHRPRAETAARARTRHRIRSRSTAGRSATVYTPEREEAALGVQQRLLPALASLLAVARERERLEREAFEAEALRRSDAIKTAVIQAVSHDLRTPLATIEQALDGLESGVLALTEEDREQLLRDDSRRAHAPQAARREPSRSLAAPGGSRRVDPGALDRRTSSWRRRSRSCAESDRVQVERPARSAAGAASTPSRSSARS